MRGGLGAADYTSLAIFRMADTRANLFPLLRGEAVPPELNTMGVIQKSSPTGRGGLRCFASVRESVHSILHKLINHGRHAALAPASITLWRGKTKISANGALYTSLGR